MADEVQYASGPDAATNKTKYGDQTPPPPSSGTLWATGFSTPIASQSPDSGHAPSSHSSVPPPVDDAKQRSKEISARLLSNVKAKSPRVGSFDSNDNSGRKRNFSNISSSSPPVSYGQPDTSKKFDIPKGREVEIAGGKSIQKFQHQSGARIQVTSNKDIDPNSPPSVVQLMGTPEQIAKAEKLINERLAETENGGSGTVSQTLTEHKDVDEQFKMKIPKHKESLIIGHKDEIIQNMQASTGAHIEVIPSHLTPEENTEIIVWICGTTKQIESAKQSINGLIGQGRGRSSGGVVPPTSTNRPRNPSMTGRHSQKGNRPPTSWAPPGPLMQQPGYGYVQPGAFPSPSPQYGTYGGYPQPTSGGYATGWHQTTVPTNQQTSQGGGYDYYSQTQTQQQQVTGAPATTDSTGYGYGLQPASGYNQQGQVYSQAGYGGCQAIAPQPAYGQAGYDQQQGYKSTPGYGNATNPTPDWHTPSYGAPGDTNQAPASQQGYSAGQQPSPNPATYPSQGYAQSGYGVPQTSQAGYGTLPTSGYGPSFGAFQTQKPAYPSAYGQPQQSLSGQGSYVQPAPVQPGYPHTQPPAQSGYAQQESDAQQAPPSSYGTATAQPGYAPPAYGAPPGSQPGYGHSYGGGYSQPPVYSANANASGNAPTSQTVQPSGVAKASPQS